MLAYVSLLSSVPPAVVTTAPACALCPKPFLTNSERMRFWSSTEETRAAAVFRRRFPPVTTLFPAMSTRVTVLVSPGSKRTAVPAAMSRRRKKERERSNSRALLTSVKW